MISLHSEAQPAGVTGSSWNLFHLPSLEMKQRLMCFNDSFQLLLEFDYSSFVPASAVKEPWKENENNLNHFILWLKTKTPFVALISLKLLVMMKNSAWVVIFHWSALFAREQWLCFEGSDDRSRNVEVFFKWSGLTALLFKSRVKCVTSRLMSDSNILLLFEGH